MDRFIAAPKDGANSTPLPSDGDERPRNTTRTSYRKSALLGVAAGCTLACLLLIGFLTRSPKPRPRASLGLVTDMFAITLAPRSSLFTAYLTNVSDSAIFLWPPLVQREDSQGRIGDSFESRWTSDADNFASANGLSAGNTAVVSPRAGSSGTKRVRVVAKFAYDADALTRATSQVFRRLPLTHLPRTARRWLGSHGLLDGRLECQIESAWVDNPAFDPRAQGGLNVNYATFRLIPAAPPPRRDTNSGH